MCGDSYFLGLSFAFSSVFRTAATISETPALILSTCGCTSLMRSCSKRDNFSIRFPCSPSLASRLLCLTEIRYIHQKQKIQQRVPTIVSSNARLWLSMSLVVAVSVARHIGELRVCRCPELFCLCPFSPWGLPLRGLSLGIV